MIQSRLGAASDSLPPRLLAVVFVGTRLWWHQICVSPPCRGLDVEALMLRERVHVEERAPRSAWARGCVHKIFVVIIISGSISSRSSSGRVCESSAHTVLTAELLVGGFLNGAAAHLCCSPAAYCVHRNIQQQQQPLYGPWKLIIIITISPSKKFINSDLRR